MQNFLEGLQSIPTGVWLCLALFLIVATMIITKAKPSSNNSPMNTKVLTFGGMCMALSFVLSYIKLFEMPQGGSVTAASMLPILLFAFVAGPSPGLIVGVAYGFLQFLQGGYAAHWVSILLDYPIAFGVLGLIAFAPKSIKSLEVRFVVGIFIAISTRFICHVLSGVAFFSEGVANPWVSSITYNITYLSAELLITIVIGILLIRTPVYKTMKASFNR